MLVLATIEVAVKQIRFEQNLSGCYKYKDRKYLQNTLIVMNIRHYKIY